jgi:hypothetical protein
MSIGWNAALNDLILLLADFYPDSDRAHLVVRQTGLDPTEINFTGAPKIFWMRIIEEANKRDMVHVLISVVKADFSNVNFAALEQQLRQPTPSAGPRLDDDVWKGPVTMTKGLERIIDAQPTFLPITFFEIGLSRSKSVVRVESPLGMGTGFLIMNNLLITNNHVISNQESAQKSKIWFNYQKTITGADAQVEEFNLDPDTAFVTSSVNDGDDWTAVAVRGNPNAQWGSLELVDVTVKTDDFVNIIQHPGGMPKQIALYHNIVAFADDSRVQYLTDTMPGFVRFPGFRQ